MLCDQSIARTFGCLELRFDDFHLDRKAKSSIDLERQFNGVLMMDMRLPHLLLFTLESILRLTLRHGKTETLLSFVLYSQYFSTIQTYSTIDHTIKMVMIFITQEY